MPRSCHGTTICALGLVVYLHSSLVTVAVAATYK